MQEYLVHYIFSIEFDGPLRCSVAWLFLYRKLENKMLQLNLCKMLTVSWQW